MLHNFLTADASTAAGGLGGMSSILFLVIIFVVFYFFLIRPENKRKKKLTEMRNNISIGDEIVTIGGIMGKVVQVTEDTITFETGEDRVPMKSAIEAACRAGGRRQGCQEQEERRQDLGRGEQDRRGQGRISPSAKSLNSPRRNRMYKTSASGGIFYAD